MAPDEVHTYTAADGWQAPLRRYRADGPPVVLVHGMAANHHNWDFDPRISLAHALQQAGWDAWVVVLPGDEGSVAPPGASHDDVSFADLADLHLPAAVDTVGWLAGQEQVWWVGHSMGGMLLYAALGGPPVAGGVAISAADRFDAPTPLVRLGRVLRPSGGDTARAAERFAWTVPVNPVVDLVARRRHMDGGLTRGLATHAIDESPQAVRDDMNRFVADGTFTRDDGSPLVDPTVDKPLLALSGHRDRLVSVADARASCEAREQCTFVELHGYGHVDPVLGVTAADEVYPRVIQWLDAQRSQEHGP